MFPSPPLKFRTTGFPQYGFKWDVEHDLRHRTTYTCPKPMAFESVALSSMPCQLATNGPPIQRPFAQRRVVLSRHLKRYYGLICASRNLSPIYVLDDGSLLHSQFREGPHFLLHVYVDVPPSVPRRTKRMHLAVASPLVQAFAVSALAQHPHLHAVGSHVVASRGCKVRFMLRPIDWLALHRQGLLRSSFHLRSHLPKMSSMTTRAHSQFPRPDLHRQHMQLCGLQTDCTD